MRRTLITVGSLAAAGMLALGLSQSAYAAEGVLIVNGQAFENPAAGCYATDEADAQVDNQTNTDLEVYADSECSAGPVGDIPAGSSGEVAPGGSVRIR
ncbi:hypothetical protein ACFVH0_09800 [Streptomyces sp. NPDC127117]|uniref:hypothetical protein n=1 Tax=Streptomyces sp. NPDC127117 TaxID=3345368 RepID=UPI00363BAC44